MTIELGLSLGVSPRESFDRFISIGTRAEEIGAKMMWVIDSQLAMKDAYIALALLAKGTSKLNFGPGVTNLITRHPTVVANAMNTLAFLAPGRLQIGIGVGDSAVFPIGRKPMSIADCEQGIRELRSLLRGETKNYGAGDVALSFTANPVPPIFLAASQPRTLELAGLVADGVLIMGPSDPETVKMQMEAVDAGARRAGRDPSEIVRDLWVTIAVGGQSAINDVKSWASAQARWLTKWKTVPASLEVYRSEMDHAAASYDFQTHLSRSAEHATGISDEFAKVLAVVGDEQECRGRLESLCATNVNRITLTLLSGGRERRLDEIASVWSGMNKTAALEQGPSHESEVTRAKS
jgi:5,10-methylenetetrahydromethanopterin reductase